MPKLRRTTTNSHLLCNTERIYRAFENGLWIRGATKHMTSHRVAFDIYEVISPYNVRLGDDSVAQEIGM